MLEGRMDQTVSDYLAEQFASNSDLTNFTFYMIASQLKTRLYVEEPGQQLSIMQAAAAARRRLQGGDDDEDNDKDDAAEDDDNEENSADHNTSDEAEATFSDGKTLVELVTHKRTFVRKHSARGYYGNILGVKHIERYKKGTLTLHHKLDHMSMRLRYYVLLEAMSRAKTPKGKEKRLALEWLRTSSKAQKLLTRSYEMTNPNRRYYGDDVGFGDDVDTPKQILNAVISVELQRNNGGDDDELERIYLLKPPLFARFNELGTQKHQVCHCVHYS
jgi:hypothetical protein